MFAGQMGCEALNFLLKRLIKEERPKRTSSGGTLIARALLRHSIKDCVGVRPLKREEKRLTHRSVIEMYGKGYGMPSSHAQFLAYFSISLSLFLLIRHNPPTPPQSSPSSQPLPYSHRPLNLLQRSLLSVLTMALAASVALSRIYLNYHTPTQVSVGCVAGGACAIAWFGATEWARREGWVDVGLDSWAGRMGRWRDLVVEEDLAESGWNVWEERRKRRREQRRVNEVGRKKRR